MGLLRLTNKLLRDRSGIYRELAEGRALGGTCLRLLVIFAVTAGVYGAAMGSFRCFHPQFFFSDFESSDGGAPKTAGKVAGLSPDKRRVYLRDAKVQPPPGSLIRFNTSRPSAPYRVVASGSEGGFAYVDLDRDGILAEAAPWKQVLAVAVKIPALFLFSLLTCALALYVLNLAFSLNLHFAPVMALLSMGLAATGVMLGVFFPIALLFSVVTGQYHFMIVMHVLIFMLAGLFGVRVLSGGLSAMTNPERAEVGLAARIATGLKTRMLLASWLLLYALVGGQMAWTLKPYLGTPYLPATPPFRVESGNIYVSFVQSLFRVAN